jgi:glycosidase
MDRAAGYLSLSTGEMYTAASLYILSSGSPFMYYGEEIGIKGSRGGANTDANRRLAMLWGDGDTIKDPYEATYNSSLQINGTVADQIKDEASLYNHYKKLIMIRNAYPEIARGNYEALIFTTATVGGFKSTYNGSTVYVIHNTSAEPIEVDLTKVKGVTATELKAFAGLNNATLDGNTLIIGGQTSVVLK